jgi:hypothetical protein
MTRLTPIVLLLVASCVAIFSWASSAGARTIHQHLWLAEDSPRPVQVTRLVEVPPPDTDDDGCRDSRDDYDGPGCNPPPVSIPTPAVSTTYATGSCPASLAGESTSPVATNPDSGASGCIQALPSTWDQYGDPAYPEASDAPVSVQMEALARICAEQGNDAWVAADPCG